MRASLILSLLAAAAVCNASGHERTVVRKTEPQRTQRSMHEQTVEWTTTYREETGNEITETNSYIEMSTGLNRWDAGSQEWVAADPSIVIENGKGVIKGAAYQAVLEPDIDSAGALKVTMPDGKELIMQTVGIGLADDTGKSVFIGEIQPSVGELVDATTVVYPNAFAAGAEGGIKASVRVKASLSGIENDVVLEERISRADVAALGLNADTARIEIWHQVMGSPGGVKRPGWIQRQATRRDRDDQVDLGRMVIGMGTAFPNGNGPGEERGIPVAKEWTTVQEIPFLIESLPFIDAEAELEKLPERQQALKIDRDALDRGYAAAAGDERKMPFSMVAERDKRKRIGNVAMKVVKESPLLAGYVIDYTVALLGGDITDPNPYVFKSDVTYHIKGRVEMYSACVIEGGSVLKFAPLVTTSPYGPWVRIRGKLDCKTSPYRPAILTAETNVLVGESIQSPAAGHQYYGNYHLWIVSTAYGEVEVHDIISHSGNTGIGISAWSGTSPARVWNVQTYNSHKGLELNVDTWVHNALLVNSGHAMLCAATTAKNIRAEHVTVDGASYYFHAYNNSPATLHLTNSLIAAAANGHTGTVNVDGETVGFPQAGTDPSPFQSVGSGSHYLAQGSLHRNAGRPDVSPRMKRILAETTTYPPQVIANNFVVDTILNPHATRDTDVPDLGYHFIALDYLAGGKSVMNAAITLTNGVAVGVYGVYGLDLKTGAKVTSVGAPGRMNRIVRHAAVQGAPLEFGGSAVTMSMFQVAADMATLPELRFEFTEISQLANAINRRTLLDTKTYSKIGSLQLIHCEVYGARLDMMPFDSDGIDSRVSSVELKNNLIERSSISLTEGYDNGTGAMKVSLWNNHLRYGGLSLNRPSLIGIWAVHDNLFEECTLSSSGSSFPNTHNAYYNAGMFSGESNSKILTILDFVDGPEQRYYYPLTGPSGGLRDLVNAGSRGSDAAGLYHFSTLPNGEPEGNTTVDIGRHLIRPAARYIGQDDLTQGNWKGKYGAEGFNIIGDEHHYADSTTVTPLGKSDWTWSADTTTETRTLQRASSNSRLAACWVSATSFEIVIDIAEGSTKRLAIYCMDYGSSNQRAQKVEILNRNGTATLESQTVTHFSDGRYLVWDVFGDVRIRVTNLGPYNCVISGLFFDEAAPPIADSDQDGLANYAEDLNANGLHDAGETSTNLADTDGDLVPDGVEISRALDPLSKQSDLSLSYPPLK